MEYNRSYNINTTCRICLHEKSDMISIFRNDHTRCRINDLISYCSSIHIIFEHNSPNNICHDCLKELDISVNFKKKCIHSEKVLKQYFKNELSNIKLEPEESNNHKIESPLLHKNDNNSVNYKSMTNVNNEISKKSANELIFGENETNMNCNKTSKTNNVNNSKECKMLISKVLDSKQSEEFEKKDFSSKKNLISNKNENRYKQTKNKKIKYLGCYKCETCNLQCQNKWVLKVHMRTHSGEKPFQCDLCKKRFVSNSNMRMHKRLTHNEDKQVCSECGKSFSCLTYLKRHLIIHYKVKPYGCTICQKRFTTKSYLKEHIARHQGDKRFFCEICASKFISDVNLKQHMLVHGIQNRNFKRHQCTFCDYKTMGKVDLARHIRKHTGEKPFRCPEEGCQSAFAGKASLKLHIRIHTGEKPYTCSECPAKFSRGDKYKNHMLKKHNITNIGPNKRSKLIVRELAEAIENGQTTTIPMDILKITT